MNPERIGVFEVALKLSVSPRYNPEELFKEVGTLGTLGTLMVELIFYQKKQKNNLCAIIFLLFKCFLNAFSQNALKIFENSYLPPKNFQ